MPLLWDGINLYGAGITYNLLSHDVLAKKVSQTIDVERQLCRICKYCFSLTWNFKLEY